MKILPAEGALVEEHAGDVPQLVWSTGPISYEFYFETYEFFEEMVRESWTTAGTLFAADGARLAVEGDELLGIEIGFHAPEFVERRRALAACSQVLMERGSLTRDRLTALLERSEQASWLNPVTRPERYYIHAIAVKPEHRGKKVGVALIDDAIRRGREQGCRFLELDVLSDNPAVRFYESLGLELYAETRAPAPEAFGVPPEYRMGRAI